MVVAAVATRHYVPSGSRPDPAGVSQAYAEDVPPFDPAGPDRGASPRPACLTVWAAGLPVGVRSLRRRGDAWPVGRTVMFVGVGMGLFYLATSSGLAAYDTTLLSVHMVQHMVLSMLVPLALALGAPVTLALRHAAAGAPALAARGPALPGREGALLPTADPAPLRRLAVGASTSPGGTPRRCWTRRTHEMMHAPRGRGGAVLLAAGGRRPAPGRSATLPDDAGRAHAPVPRVPRVTIMGQETLLGGDHYTALRERAAYCGSPTPSTSTSPAASCGPAAT